MINGLNPREFASNDAGELTIADIFLELKKPGRDPRPEFKTAKFKDGIESLADLKPGLALEGVVTNVTNFGAFVDIGVHQDGLVHVSQLANKFVSDPNDIVKVGQIVQVKVVEVDVARKRIQLTMKQEVNAQEFKPLPKAPLTKPLPESTLKGDFSELLKKALKH